MAKKTVASKKTKTKTNLKQNSKQQLIVMFGLALVVVVSAGLYLRSVNANNNTTNLDDVSEAMVAEAEPSESPKPTGQIVNPGEYHNEAENFKLLFPADWSLIDTGKESAWYKVVITSPGATRYKEGPDGEEGGSYTNNFLKKGYDIGVFAIQDSKPGRDLYEYVLESGGPPAKVDFPQSVADLDTSKIKKFTTKAGHAAVQFTWAFEGVHVETIIPVAGKVYTLSYNYAYPDAENAHIIDEGGLAVYQQIIDSFNVFKQ